MLPLRGCSRKGVEGMRAGLFSLLLLLIQCGTDLRRRRVYTLPSMLFLAGGSAWHLLMKDLSPVLLAGGIGLGGLLALAARLTGECIGYGDCLVIAALGAVLGAPVLWEVFCMGMVFAALASVLLLLSGRATRKTRLPFVPFLLAGQLAQLALSLMTEG